MNKKVKIAHLSSVHFALDTRIFYKQCSDLAQLYEVKLVAIHPKRETINNVEIIPFKRFKNRYLRVLFTWAFMFFKAIKINAKVYHFHDPELIPCGILLRGFGKKVIWDIHENIADDIFDKPWIKQQKFAFYSFLTFEKIALKLFYIILAEKSYLKRYENKTKNITLILNYCDTHYLKPYIKTDYSFKYNLYYIGILLENRAILEIIESIYDLKKRGLMYKFHCVGELFSDLNKKIKNLTFYNEIKDQLFFYGRLSLDEGYQLAQNMDLGLCLIYPMKNSEESYPTKIFEYMYVGLPVLTSNFTLYKEIVEKNEAGLCISPNSINEIVESIINLTKNSEKNEIIGRNSSKIVKENYNWESEKIKLISLYSLIINQLK